MANRRKTAWVLGVLGFLLLLILACIALYNSLLPLFIAFGLAYACSPVVDWFERRGVPRSVTALTLLLMLAGLVVLAVAVVLPFLIRQGQEFLQSFPSFFETALARVQEFAARFGIRIPADPAEFLNRFRGALPAGGAASLSPVVEFTRRFVSGVAAVFVAVLNFLIIPVFFFYFLRDLPRTRRYVYQLFPPRFRPAAKDKFVKVDRVLAGYIRGEFLVATILAVIYAVALSIAHIKFGLIIGVVAGYLNIVPYVGQGTGFLVSLIMVLVDYTGVGRLIAVPAIFGGANFLEGNFITPRIVGNRVGLTPVWTIIALIIGGSIAGLLGLIIAIPVAGSVKVLLADVMHQYRNSEFYG